jgi:isoleucyl-tRNA synthetase
MPYAQVHYPFAMKDPDFRKYYPADFIAEGVDQTRGWFFTLHAIAVMLFDSVAYKNIISNGLCLDKNGNKMSKRLGNAVDPFDVILQHGSDPLRWYMITNAQPWDNLKFDIDGVDEVKRKFFGTFYNTYSFFALYANIDGFTCKEPDIPVQNRPEIDRWIISLLNSLIADVESYYEDYEPTKAGRAIQHFVTENLSNWYVRLNRKRYWGGEYTAEKLAAYQTLYTCLITIVKLAAPLAPFYMDKVYRDLNHVTRKETDNSVHLAEFPSADISLIDRDLEDRMELAQNMSSMVLGLRRKVNIKVRQPLHKIMVPVPDPGMVARFEAVKHLILGEVNVKELEYLKDTSGILVKKIKPNFKLLGPRYGKLMKDISVALAAYSQEEIQCFEASGTGEITAGGERIVLHEDDVEITSEDIPGWLVANEGKLTVALDVNITQELKDEGIAREFVNRIQNIRKDSGFEVTDKIAVEIQQMELGAFLADARAEPKRFEALVTGIPGDVSLSHVAAMFETSQAGGALDYSGFHNPSLDHLLQRARDATDEEEMRRAWVAIEDALTVEVPVVWLYHSQGVQGVRRSLRGLRMDLRGELVSVTQWHLGTGANGQ